MNIAFKEYYFQEYRLTPKYYPICDSIIGPFWRTTATLH